MAAISIEDMKQRILKPRRSALNAKGTDQATSASTAAPVDGPRGQTHPPVEPGALAHQARPTPRFQNAEAVPSGEGFYRGTTSFRIPKPSELFGIHTGMLRNPTYAHPPPAPTHAPMQPVPTGTVLSSVPQLPPPGVLSAPSVSRQREHDRRMRVLSTKMQKANLKRRLEAFTHPPTTDDHTNLLPTGVSSTDPPAWLGMLSGLRRWAASANTDPEATMSSEQDAGVHLEFDTDVVDALVYTVGRWMGLDTEQLRDSPGLRTLVSRNIQWFRNSPDWMKLLGLVLAKKLNHTLDCPKRSVSDTQRMLLDRMLSPHTMPAVPVTGSDNGGVLAELPMKTETGADVLLPPPSPPLDTVPVTIPSAARGKRSRSRSREATASAKATTKTAKTKSPPKASSTKKQPSPKRLKTCHPTKATMTLPSRPQKKRARSRNPSGMVELVPGILPPVSLDAETTEAPSTNPTDTDPLFAPPSLTILSALPSEEISPRDPSDDVPSSD